MREVIDTLAAIYCNYFNKHGEDEGFKILRFQSVVSVLCNLYQTFISEGIAPIELIEMDKKKKYYTISIKYYSRLNERIKASKAAYVLELITSNY
jgi:hypothetical protein